MCLVDANVKAMLQWAPIPYDGTFYKTDALDKFKTQNLNLNIPLVIGSNSYEGIGISILKPSMKTVENGSGIPVKEVSSISLERCSAVKNKY